MSDNWYYTQDGKNKIGPVPFTVLQQLATSGALQPTNMVRQESSGRWSQAKDVPGLFSTATPQPQPSSASGIQQPTAFASIKARAQELWMKFLALPKNTRYAVIGGGAAGTVLMTCFCCGLLGLIGGGTGGGSSTGGGNKDAVLSADYYPHLPGTERRFKDKGFNPVKKEWFETKGFHRMIHHKDGTIETIGPPPINNSVKVKHRQQDGFVELGLSDGNWNPVIKIGAKPGDTWERNRRQYTFKEFTTFMGKPCAVVSTEYDWTDSRGTTVRKVLNFPSFVIVM